MTKTETDIAETLANYTRTVDLVAIRWNEIEAYLHTDSEALETIHHLTYWLERGLLACLGES
jgi:hypothetical protein